MASGSIRKRERADGVRYEAVVDFGLDPATGKRIQRSKAFKTKREAREYLTASLSEVDKGTFVDRSRQTVAEMMAYWLDTEARPRLRGKTVFDYENTIRNHILPELGTIPIQKLTADRLHKFYADKTAAGVGPRTIRLCHLHLRQALRQATRLGLVARNVADLVSPPKGQPKEMKVWTYEQAQTFLAVAGESIYGPIWILALATGMRRGELLGVRWKDVDLGRRTLQVRQTVGSLRGRIEFKPPKTRSSMRTVSLPKEVVAILREHKRRQNERRLALGEAWNDHDLVFAVGTGNPIHPDNVRHDFARLVRKAGVPLIRVHDQRHTHVTLGLAAGVNLKALSEAVGHRDISITLGIYGHVLAEQRVEVADKMGSVLFGPKEDKGGTEDKGTEDEGRDTREGS